MYLGMAVSGDVSWQRLTTALVAALHGDVTAFDRLDTEAAGESGDQEPTPQEERTAENESMSMSAVLCLDSPSAPKTLADARHRRRVRPAVAALRPCLRLADDRLRDLADRPHRCGRAGQGSGRGTGAAGVVHRRPAHSTGERPGGAPAVGPQLAPRTQGPGACGVRLGASSTCTDRAVDGYLVGGKLPDKVANCSG